MEEFEKQKDELREKILLKGDLHDQGQGQGDNVRK
jgi:hypothetical protein